METSRDSFVLVQQGRQDLGTQKIKAHSSVMSYNQLEPLKIMRFMYMLKYAEWFRTWRAEEPDEGEERLTLQ